MPSSSSSSSSLEEGYCVYLYDSGEWVLQQDHCEQGYVAPGAGGAQSWWLQQGQGDPYEGAVSYPICDVYPG